MALRWMTAATRSSATTCGATRPPALATVPPDVHTYLDTASPPGNEFYQVTAFNDIGEGDSVVLLATVLPVVVRIRSWD